MNRPPEKERKEEIGCAFLQIQSGEGNKGVISTTTWKYIRRGIAGMNWGKYDDLCRECQYGIQKNL